jgi:hypothetical protein
MQSIVWKLYLEGQHKKRFLEKICGNIQSYIYFQQCLALAVDLNAQQLA